MTKIKTNLLIFTLICLILFAYISLLIPFLQLYAIPVVFEPPFYLKLIVYAVVPAVLGLLCVLASIFVNKKASNIENQKGFIISKIVVFSILAVISLSTTILTFLGYLIFIYAGVSTLILAILIYLEARKLYGLKKSI